MAHLSPFWINARLARFTGLMVLAASSAQSASAQSASVSVSAFPAITTYCVSCHRGAAPAAGVSLEQLGSDRSGAARDTRERVIRQMRARTMPPMASPRPDHAAYETTITALIDDADRDAEATARPLRDGALARRLAKLIWNGAPDQSLREAASTGALGHTGELRAQVRRMLGDPRALALVQGFFAPWLSLESVGTMKSDGSLFPEFDAELRAALQRETTLFVQSQLRDDRHPADLWTANYTFLDERLARHYGIPGISGPDFRRITWPDERRAGLLAQGSVLTLTSRPFVAYPLEVPTTSPAERAKWILTRFLGVDPPATVQGVPPEDFPFDRRLPLATQGRTFPATPCLVCHRAFFPLSYGLENFDVLGRWRSDYDRNPIDASGTMVDGTVFNGPTELRRALLERQDAFLNSLAERLMAYAIDGTTAVIPTPPSRMPIVRAALHESAADNHSWSSLLAAIAKWAPQEP